MNYLNSELCLGSFKIGRLLGGYYPAHMVVVKIKTMSLKASWHINTQEILVFSVYLLRKRGYVEFLHTKYSNLKYYNFWIF